MTDAATLTIGALHKCVEAIFRKAGLNAIQAAAVSRTIVAGERDACKSHGIFRIEGALRTIKAGRVKRDAVPEVLSRQTSSIVQVDAKGGFASPALELGVPVLVERARTYGIAALAVNDAVHFSALWSEIEAVTQEGLVGLAMCPSYAAVAPSGGNKPLLGTNPFAFGWPREETPPYVFDFATSVAARGEIELHLRAGTPLPEGWAIDAEGKPTTDPKAALEGAMLPFGDYKGSAISTMIELIAGVMIGDLTSPDAEGTKLYPSHGELLIAFSPESFSMGRPGNPMARAETLFEKILAQGARLPSQRRFAAREKSKTEGVIFSSAEMGQLDRFLAEGLDAV